ncbi:GAF domain-containing protein [Herpetosiphon sp. NSE202]|uniref:GAF domain-containing protein n=1 Tax=Herpetosiphon sp. NSE202 TaxID=3351349 RepID=UPI003644EEDF
MTQRTRKPTLKSRVEALEAERHQTQRALDALYRIGLACRGQQDSFELLRTIYQELQTVWQFDACFIALSDQYDDSAYRIAMLVDEGVIEFSEHDPIGPLTGYLIRQRQPLLFRDLTIERESIGLPRLLQFGSDKLSRGWMGVPLVIGTSALGVISLQSYTVGAFDEADLDLLTRIANSMAVALENALLSHRQAELTGSLERQIELRNADLFVISDIAAMLTQQLPLTEMFGLALDFMLELMHLDAGVVCSLNANELQPIVQRGLPNGSLPESFVALDSIFGIAISSNNAIVDHQSQSKYWQMAQLNHLATTLAIPLRRHETVIGVLLVGQTEQRDFKTEEVELLQVVSNQLALALEHGNILAQQRRQIAELEALSAISAATVRALNLSTLLHQLNDAIRSFLPVDVFYMAIYDPERQLLTDSIAIEDDNEATYLSEEAMPRKGSFTDWVLSKCEPLFLRHVSRDIRHYPTIIRRTIKGSPSESWLGVPMLDANRRPLGVIAIQNYQPYAFSDRDRFFLQSVASQVSLHVLNVQLYQQRERQLAELNALQRISSLLGSTLEIEAMLRAIDAVLTEFLHIDGFFVMLNQPKTHMVEAVYALNREGEGDFRWMIGLIPPEHTPTWEVLHTRKPLRFGDISQETSTAVTPEDNNVRISSERTKAWLGVPLNDQTTNVIGLIAIQSFQANVFSTRDEQFMAQLGQQLTLAIQNARLFAQRERQLNELNTLKLVGELLNRTMDIHEMFRGLNPLLTSFLNIDGFYILLNNPKTYVIEDLCVVERGELLDYGSMVGTSLPPNTPTAWILRNAKALRFNNTVTDIPQLYPELKTVQVNNEVALSWLGTPLINHRGEVLGAITTQSLTASHFSESDEQFMLQVAHQLGLAIQNARSFAQRERQLAELDAQQRITQLVTSTLDLYEMLRSLDLVLRSFLNADAFQVVIGSADRVETAVVLEEGHEVQTAVIGHPLPDGSLTRWTYLHVKPLRMNDIYRDWALHPDLVEPPIPTNSGFMHSWLSVPLIASAQPLGVLAVRATRPAAFGPSDEQFLFNVGRQLALSVRNARLYAAEQTAHRTAETMREIARVLNTTFNPDEVLDLILRELRKVITFDSTSVMLPSNNLLRIVARQAQDEQLAVEWRELTFPLDLTSGAGRVMLSGKPLVVPDTVSDPQWTRSPMPSVVRSWIGVPLISKGVVLGVLNINSLQPNAFTQGDTELAMTFANQAATALEHARLYQESVTRVEQELEIARQIQSNLFPRSLPVAHGVELAAVCLPARETGGDFYEVTELRDGRWALMVGDASGKSIPGAMLMAVARSIVRSEAWDHETPQIVMQETNRWVTMDIPRHTFVALAYATFDIGDKKLALANAGQLDPIIRRANGDLVYATAPGPHFPLGILANTPYETASYQLEPNDMVLFYTDGVVESKNNTGDMWGFERFEALLRQHEHSLTSAEWVDLVINEINQFIGDHPQHDDITLVALKVAGA